MKYITQHDIFKKINRVGPFRPHWFKLPRVTLTNRRKCIQYFFVGQEIYLVSSKISFLAIGQKL